MQNNVTVCTKESDLDVYSLINPDCKWKELALASVKYIYSDLNDIRKNYMRLGFHLDEFNRCGYYHYFGYGDFYSFAERYFSMDKSAVSRCIAVFRNFAVKDDNGILHCEIDPYFEKYSYSQLCEMVSLPWQYRKKIKADMTVRQIRELKKGFGKNVSRAGENVSHVATSQQENTGRDFDYDPCRAGDAEKTVSYIKNVRPISAVRLHFYDADGNPVLDGYCDVWADIIYDKGDDLVFRFRK